MQCRLRESCGYEPDVEPVATGDLYSLDNSLKRFYEVLSSFQSSLYEAHTMRDIMDTCEQFFHEVRCPNVYLTINDTYLYFDREQDLSSYAPISHLMALDGPANDIACDEQHMYASFPAEDILPEAMHASSSAYVVYPLRRMGTCIGTVVTQGLSPLMAHGFLTFCLTTLAAEMESVRSISMLREVNSRLDNLYMHDEFTGLFNRFGLERFGTIAYENLLRDSSRAQIIFVDVDDMKGINDKFGHESGDCALCETADIIRRSTMGQNAFAMRYGGDEFLLICKNNLIPRLEQELALLKKSVMEPYDLSLSMGVVEVVAADHLSVDEAINLADAKMHQIKKARKALRS